jgi:hypothetical protein
MLRLIFLIVILVLALSFFGISLRSIVESPTGQENIAYVWSLIMDAWNRLSQIISNYRIGM